MTYPYSTTTTPARCTVHGIDLFALGNLELLTRLHRAVAVVGARTCTPYGGTVTRDIADNFARRGLIVVSGLARGVDTEAHRAALDAASASTIAVLGCGIDHPYPRSNFDLYQRILDQGGLILSEYEPGTEPAPWRFPARNRVVASLALLGTVVVEARERSGALITVDYAMEMGRDVYAVPGPVDSSLSRGTNVLIRDHGAHVMLSPTDLQLPEERGVEQPAADGKIEVIVIPYDDDPYIAPIDRGLEAAQALVDGSVQVVPTAHGLAGADLWMNEEGKLEGQMPNDLATALCELFPGDWIAGTAFLTGPPDDDGETTSVSTETIAAMAELCRSRGIVLGRRLGAEGLS